MRTLIENYALLGNVIKHRDKIKKKKKKQITLGIRITLKFTISKLSFY